MLLRRAPGAVRYLRGETGRITLTLAPRRGHIVGVIAVVGLALVLAGALLAVVILTGLGAHRRGLAALPAALAGLFSPVTWTVWYLRDERPYGSAHRHAA
jgi:hypothetical protein